MVFESSYCYIVQCPQPPAWFSNAQFFSILGIPLPDPPQLEKQQEHDESEHDNSDFLFRIVSVMKSIQIENNHHIH